MTSKSEEPPTQVRTKKHRVILLLFSGLLVFAAFIVRDELREDVRELASSISSAQVVFESRQDVSVLSEQIRTSQALENEILFYVLATQAGETPKIVPIASHLWKQYKLEGFSSYLASYTVSFDNIRRLLEFVPDSEQSKRLADLTNRVSDLQHRCEALRATLGDNYEQEQNIDFKPLSAGVSDVSRDIQSLSQEVLANAKKAEYVAEHRYEFVTRMSIGLVALGLIVAFVAKLLGVDVFEVG